jgi:TonB family protein
LPDRVPQGNVIVRVIISEQGKVLRAQILRGPGSGREVESAAVEALKGWLFEPATLQGKPVAVYMNLVLN